MLPGNKLFFFLGAAGALMLAQTIVAHFPYTVGTFCLFAGLAFAVFFSVHRVVNRIGNNLAIFAVFAISTVLPGFWFCWLVPGTLKKLKSRIGVAAGTGGTAAIFFFGGGTVAMCLRGLLEYFAGRKQQQYSDGKKKLFHCVMRLVWVLIFRC